MVEQLEITDVNKDPELRYQVDKAYRTWKGLAKNEDCMCFSSYIRKEKPELVEQLEKEDVNSNPELRAQVDEAYQAWQGGSMN